MRRLGFGLVINWAMKQIVAHLGSPPSFPLKGRSRRQVSSPLSDCMIPLVMIRMDPVWRCPDSVQCSLVCVHGCAPVCLVVGHLQDIRWNVLGNLGRHARGVAAAARRDHGMVVPSDGIRARTMLVHVEEGQRCALVPKAAARFNGGEAGAWLGWGNLGSGNGTGKAKALLGEAQGSCTCGTRHNRGAARRLDDILR